MSLLNDICIRFRFFSLSVFLCELMYGMNYCDSVSCGITTVDPQCTDITFFVNFLITSFVTAVLCQIVMPLILDWNLTMI